MRGHRVGLRLVRLVVGAMTRRQKMNAPTTEHVFDVVPYVAKRRTAEVIQLRARGEWATFYVDDPGHAGPGYFVLAIESSFGGFAYAWSHPGGDFKRFLADLDCGYARSKMVGLDTVFDGAATARALRAAIEQRGLGEEIAHEEIALLEDLEGLDDASAEAEFYAYCQNTTVLAAPWEYACTKPGERSRDFEAIYELFWEPFVTELLIAAPRSA